MEKWTTETAEWYAEKYGEYATNRLAVDALEIAENAAIVDVGCGTGAALRHVSSRVPDGSLIGVDPIKRMVEIARERAASHPQGTRIEFREGPAEKLPVDDSCADVVFAFDSMDHWENRAQGLAEVRRVLKPKGQFVVVKDGGLPDGEEARTRFLTDLSTAGFALIREDAVDAEDVSFTMWTCAIAA